MAAKLLHSLADDNPDLQKQIGCMNGIFQIFERQHLISGRRPNQRRLLPPPSGSSKFGNGDMDAESSSAYNRETLEKNPNKNANEKRTSTESSRASFSSSSRSSSFSSLDCVRTGQPEPSSMDRIIFPETPSRDPVISQTSASPKMGRLSVDIRDVVKDSMYRDSRTLSVQTVVKEDGSSHSLKHYDSPRPLQLSKSVDGALGVGKGNNMAADIKESMRVLAKLRDAQWNYNEKEVPTISNESKEESFFSRPKDGPRFSYDGREINRKIKDLPRLSLDSRESSARGYFIDPKLSSNSSNERVACVQQPLTNQSRHSIVVAKLMGLDSLPASKRSNESQLGPIKIFSEERRPSLAPLRVPDACRPVRLPKSPRSTRKESTSPRWKNADAVMKPVSTSKIHIEPAPWKHVDSGRASPKHASKPMKSTPSTSSTSPSVYGEIEKRLKDIEFKQSGKDLRALKQILEAMQAKGLLEATKDEQSLDLRNKRDHDGSEMRAGTTSSNDFHTGRAINSKQKGSVAPKAFESPIVIMKPAKLVQKCGIPASSIIPIEGLPALQRPHSNEGASHRKNSVGTKTLKDQTVKDGRRDQVATSDKKHNNRSLRVTSTSSRSSQVVKDNPTNSSKNPGSISPRLQQKKLEFDKRSRPPTPPADSNKSRRQPRQSTEAGSPGGRRRSTKASALQQHDDPSSGKCDDSRNLGCQEDYVSHSDVNMSLESRKCTEGSQKPVEVGISHIPSANKHWVSEEDDMSLRLSEEDIVGDLAIAPEQPSPVSVLDSSAYMEGSPSPVEQSSPTLEVAKSGETGEDMWDSVDANSTEDKVLEFPSEISRKKLQSIDNLVQKLRRLNSTHDEAQTDYIASLCENTNPDHRYISEILLASGLLLRELSTGLTAFQLHPSGHPINPELFFVLEQTKASSLLAKGENDETSLSKSKPEKFHRKLIFDAVNEILAEKLALMGPPPEPWLKPVKLAKNTLNAQKLLRELCSEIELVQDKKHDLSSEEEDDGLKNILWEDVMRRSDSWTDFRTEISSIVLDVERSIFKDLVNEIIIGEVAGLRRKPNSRCRQLFSK
ncbi:unnamed protein product [Amaranthus hypochondriacus]